MHGSVMNNYGLHFFPFGKRFTRNDFYALLFFESLLLEFPTLCHLFDF